MYEYERGTPETNRGPTVRHAGGPTRARNRDTRASRILAVGDSSAFWFLDRHLYYSSMNQDQTRKTFELRLSSTVRSKLTEPPHHRPSANHS